MYAGAGPGPQNSSRYANSAVVCCAAGFPCQHTVSGSGLKSGVGGSERDKAVEVRPCNITIPTSHSVMLNTHFPVTAAPFHIDEGLH